MKEKIIQYNPSYSEDDNLIIHKYIANASENELVQMIRELQKLYIENVSNINEPFRQFEKEIRERDLLYQRYKVLKNNYNDWNSYYDALLNYADVLHIRKIYAQYKKKNGKYATFNNFYCLYSNIAPLGEDYFRKAIIPEGNKCFIKQPLPPHIYDNMNAIEVTPLNDDASLESIGKENLKYIIILMLYNIDSSYANAVPSILSILTRIYSGNSHKGKNALKTFTTNLLSTSELIEKNECYFQKIHRLRCDCEKLLAKIECE